jgi:metal-responsive CopG/Arc/MetJ family transcriptional regulator
MAVERVTLNLPPELKNWLEKVVQQRKAQGRRTSVTALVIEILEEKAKATSSHPALD